MIDNTQLDQDMISVDMNKHFQELPAPFYKKCLDYIRDSGTSKRNEVLMPYLVPDDDRYS